jgi:malate dehydrogenase
MKIAAIGAGQVGAAFAQKVIENELADVVFVDVAGDMAAGKALDLMESAPAVGFDGRITGGSDYSAIEGADVCVVTAGFPRLPGMDREELLDKNVSIIREVGANIKKFAPESIVINITNPLDVLSYVMMKVTGFPKNRIMGMAGVLDSSRFSAFIAMELGVSVKDVSSMVLGGHGDLMVPLPRYASVRGIPVQEFLDKKVIDRLIERTVKGGSEVVNLLKKGGAYYAPGASIYQMAEAIIKDSARILPASVYADGEYGLKDVFVGLPAKISRQGVAEVIQLALTDEELAKLRASAEKVRANTAKVKM